jgi:hypothetical protein
MLHIRSLFIPSWRRQGQLQYFYLTNFVSSNSKSIIEEVSGENFNGNVSGLVRVISAEFILEDWVKS